jgi:hypothetical protein
VILCPRNDLHERLVLGASKFYGAKFQIRWPFIPKSALARETGKLNTGRAVEVGSADNFPN